MEAGEIKRLARDVSTWATQCYRTMHKNPELSFEEKATARFVVEQLQKLGYQPQTDIGGYGIKAVFEGGDGRGKTIALRADMDALPVQEETGFPFTSVNPGVMHACGHDIHTALLLGTARAVRASVSPLKGNVVFLFQPAEERYPGGARLMVKGGVLENPHVDAIFGLHVLPSMSSGTMAFGPGPRLASTLEFDIDISGPGGHAAHPDSTVDTVYVAASLVVALQSISSRNINPFQPVVLSICTIHGGNKHNVIPEVVRLQGTVRAMQSSVQQLTLKRIEEIAAGICRIHAAGYKLSINYGYPVVINSEKETNIARQAAIDMLGEENILEMEPSTGGEDFAVFLQERPGSFGRIGASDPSDSQRYGLHTSKFRADERIIEIGIAYYISLIQRFLRDQE